VADLYWEDAPEVEDYRQLLQDPQFAEYTAGALFYVRSKVPSPGEQWEPYFEDFLPKASPRLRLVRAGEPDVVGGLTIAVPIARLPWIKEKLRQLMVEVNDEFT
jgi:hypothetical protein